MKMAQVKLKKQQGTDHHIPIDVTFGQVVKTHPRAKTEAKPQDQFTLRGATVESTIAKLIRKAYKHDL